MTEDRDEDREPDGERGREGLRANSGTAGGKDAGRTTLGSSRALRGLNRETEAAGSLH